MQDILIFAVAAAVAVAGVLTTVSQKQPAFIILTIIGGAYVLWKLRSAWKLQRGYYQLYVLFLIPAGWVQALLICRTPNTVWPWWLMGVVMTLISLLLLAHWYLCCKLGVIPTDNDAGQTPVPAEPKPSVKCPKCGYVMPEPDWRCPRCYYEFED